MNYTFKDLVDLGSLRNLCENYSKQTQTALAILDLDGNVLVATGWHDICTKFHRINPETAARCTESDTVLAGKLSRGDNFNIYQCKNGLVDVAVPIHVEGMHVGNLFTGQFFFEPPDIKYFRNQASVFQFDEKTYLEALTRIPIFSKEQVRQTTDFLCQLAEIIGSIGLARLRLLKINEDLTQEIEERKKAEKKLAAQSELLNNILNNIPLNIFWKDRALTYLGCNKVFAKDAGLADPADIIGKSDYDLPWKKEEAEFYRKCDKEVIEKNSPMIDIEESLTQAHGKERTVVTSKVPLREEDGSICGLLGIYYDITDRKLMEEMLRQSQKMESVGTLAGGVAHEFNNILSGIIGYAEIAKDNFPAKSPACENLDKILKLCTRASDIIKQILSFSRISRKEKKVLQPHLLIKEDLEVLRATIPATIDIRYNLDEKSGTILADSTQIHQIGMNLCQNAAHAMQERGGVLEIGLAPVVLDAENVKQYPGLKPGAYVKLTVSDTGTGIDPAIIDRIFDPFFTTKEVGRGTGMGLAVTHGIIKDHGGTITVESETGKGSTFTILLPQVAREKKDKTDDRELTIPGGGESILLIDDEPALVETGKKTLQSLGYKVTALQNSKEALEVFRQKPDSFDLVITDQTMPYMTGYELAQSLFLIRRDISVILCSGYSETVSEEKVREIGIKGFMHKPITKRKLAAMIRRVLENKSD